MKHARHSLFNIASVFFFFFFCFFFSCCFLRAQITLADILRIIQKKRRERKLAPSLNLSNERIQLNWKAIGDSN